MKSIHLKLTIFTFLLLIFSCEKPERNNPWDEKANLDPTAWAPQNLQIVDVSITRKRLTWSYDGFDHFQGFKIDRKKGDEQWQVAYQVFTKETRSWNDTEVIPDPSLTYNYRVYAYAGNQTSSEQNVSTSAAFPPPENFQITPNSTTSVTLNWSYSHTGHEGFRIERKIDSGSWDMLVDNLNPNRNSFNNEGLDLNEHDYSYRVYAFIGTNQSAYAEELAQYVPSIGEFYKGGIVFYLNGNSGGLVCAPSDQSADAEWGCYGSTIGGTAADIGTGAANTVAIVSGCSETGIAARICDELVLNGYSDWFLPSKDELNLMFVNLSLSGFGDLSTSLYWSSSEYSTLSAWLQSFGNGNHGYSSKSNTSYVRAVRAF